MSRVLVAGVDIGTRSSKAVLVDPRDGTLVAQASVAHGVDLLPGGGAEHDADAVWWGGTRDLLVRLVAALAPGDVIAAVGLSACGPCIVPIDTSGDPLRGGMLYGIDTRATAEVAELDARYGAASSDRFGMPFSSQSAWAKILWVERHEPEVAAATATWLTANGFVASRLTGARAIDHHQAAYLAPAYEGGSWTTEAGSRILPPLSWSGDAVGEVTPEAAQATGLAPGTPVVIGSSDGATDPLGAGVAAGPTALVRYGSTLGVTVVADGGVPAVEGLWRTPGNHPGETMLVGGLSTGGSITTWMREEFGRELPQADEAQIRAAHAALVAEAAASPAGSRGVLTLPYFAGERTPFIDPGARGVIAGLGLATTRGDLYRSALEGTAYGLRHLLEAAAAGGVEVTRLRAVGGGVAADLWVQIASDVTGLTQDVVDPHLGAPYGAARLAAESADLRSREDPSWSRVARTIEPQPDRRALHDRRYAAMRRLYDVTRPVIGEIAEDGS
jgi:xylulokinase